MKKEEAIHPTTNAERRKASYSKPECMVCEMVPESLLALSVECSDEENTYGSECLGNGRRGSWGNLWDEGN